MDKPAAGPGKCALCGRELVPDEAALTRKLINRGTKRFLCLGCLGAHFCVSEEELRRKISEFREAGCTLFEKE